jgi:hypothetical protein
MVLPITLTGQGKELSSYAMLDSGAALKRVMDKKWALEQGLELKPLRQMIKVEGFDGRENEDGPITHYTIMTLRVDDHLEKKSMFLVTQLAHYPVILGLSWLKQHDPRVQFAEHSLTFNSEFCHGNCNTPAQPSKI